MKTKLISLIVAMIAVMALLASCFGGGEGGGEGEGGGSGTGTGGGNNDSTVDTSGITYDYDWSTTNLLIEYSLHSQSNELSSGTQRYYAGEDLTKNDDIDKAVKARNKNALAATNVTVTTTYLQDGNAEYGWGSNISRIVQATSSQSDATAPDIYVNFAYDITCAQLRGCFTNLLSDDYTNYFRFNEEGYNPVGSSYFDAEAGEGYFWEYMKSLSLTPDTKMYCLASNWCIDLVRAFLVVPVNVKMMNGITAFTNLPTTDATGVGTAGAHDIADFYNLVWNNGWNYDALAAYSNVVFKESGVDNTRADINDILGFCAGTGSGLTSSGILYTAELSIFAKDEATGKYYYPEKNANLDVFVGKLRALFKDNANNGVSALTAADVTALGVASTDLLTIRNRFSTNYILFGGVIAVGSLEATEYQNMEAEGGFGVVPVPLYKDGEQYNTVVHNIARIAAIASNSTEKSQCSAYLDYLSRTSSDILNDYYEYELTAITETGEAASDNAKMMTYIRNHVRTSFDKTFEDAVTNYALAEDEEADSKRWHHIIMKANYMLDNFSVQYENYRNKKQEYLEKDIYPAWDGLK